MTEQLSFPDDKVVSVPAQRHSPESVAAARAIEPRVRNLRAMVYTAIAFWGPCTDQALADLLEMPENTTRPRRVELVQAGRVQKVGVGKTRSGRSAALWACA